MTPRLHTIAGGGGTALHVRDWGPQDAPAFLLLHGWSQSHMCWQAQTGSDLARDFRLVAMDLRGHGQSDKPTDPAAYADGTLWAEDIRATIDILGLARPVLVGWSYAGRVIGEYLATHGDAALGGILTVGAIMASGAAREDWMMGQDSASKISGLTSDDQARLIEGTRQFIRACTHRPLPAETFERVLAFNMLCPAYARRGLAVASSDTRPAYGAITCPLTIVHGAEDAVVSPQCARDLADRVPHARLEVLPRIGHAPFLEAPDRFNHLLRELAAEVNASA